MVGSPNPRWKGGGTMTVYETLSLMIAFAMLTVLVVNRPKR